MFTAEKIKSPRPEESGSALVVALIVLVILAALGYAGLEVADLNIFSSANDRDSKNTFLHADSGVNVGHEFLEDALDEANSTFYDSDANTWQDALDFNATDFPLRLYMNPPLGTYVRAGDMLTGQLPGSSAQMAAGGEGAGKKIVSFTDFLIRSHREGQRNSRAEVDMGWHHISR